ncbi:MAG TPA: 3-oxoacyl-ACP synthase [Deinococcales bacterium]|nr:3-oxoacyl-ACP synthase [Deinococcales bacterium]
MTGTVGITGLGLYLPEGRMSAAGIAAASGLPVEVVRDKLGILQKPVPGPDDHPNAMAVQAARAALLDARLDPAELDVIVCMTEEYKEYPVWTAGIDLAERLGATRAWAFDVGQKCGTFNLALHLAQALLAADGKARHVLVAGGYRNGDLVDYANPNVRFMFNLGAGAAAAVVSRGAGHPVLGSRFITDGSFSRDVIVPVGGTLAPVTAENAAGFRLQVPDPAGMKDRLEAKSLQNFLNVIRGASSDAGFGTIDYLALLHMKPSAHRYLLGQLGLSDAQSIYLNEFGHIGQVDQVLSLLLARDRGLLKPGARVVLAAAGVGYVWNAIALRWN